MHATSGVHALQVKDAPVRPGSIGFDGPHSGGKGWGKVYDGHVLQDGAAVFRALGDEEGAS